MRPIYAFDAQGNPVVRNSTAAEDTNVAALVVKANNAIAANIAALALPDPTANNNTYIALASPSVAQTNAQVKALSNQSNSVIAQLQAVTRQNTVLIRFLVGTLDVTDGT